MKKVFTTLFTLNILFFGAIAKPVSKAEAKEIAEYFFSINAPASKAGSIINQTVTETYNNEKSFYLFGFENGGFVMVSADDKAKAILGYSFTSEIPNEIGSNTRYYFDGIKKEIDDTKKSTRKSAKINTDWNALRNKELLKRASIEPLVQSTWDQWPYYNMYCPPSTPTGCVATTMSQIMRYHKWPKSGNGWFEFTPYRNPQFGRQYANFEQATYDWDNMPDQLQDISTDEQKEAVALINYHAGVATSMSYGKEGSGTTSEFALYALTSYFKYDPSSIALIAYNRNNEEDYLELLKNEIDNQRPIYYYGHGNSFGHAWLCDGYDENNMVHMNWGWGGALNGYFPVSDMVAGEYSFNEASGMIIGIQPGSEDQNILWTSHASGFKNESRGINNICAIDSRTAWASSYDASINGENSLDFTKTVDGFHWEAGTINGDYNGYRIGMISAVDANKAWATLFNKGMTGGGKVVCTSDGGKTWTHLATASFTGPNGFPNAIHFWDENNGWCQGDPNDGYFELYTTTDGGTTWNRVPEKNIPSKQLDEYGILRSYDVHGDIVWFATSKGRIFKSTDRGYNWEVYQTPFKNGTLKITFKDANTGIIQKRGQGGKSVQHITTDGGSNWTELEPEGNIYTADLKYVPGTDLLISTGADSKNNLAGVSYSTDDGKTFTDYAPFYKGSQFLAIGDASPDAIWAGNFNRNQYLKGIWKFGNNSFTAGFETENTLSCVDSEVIFDNTACGTYENISWDFGEGATPQTIEGEGPHKVSYSSGGLKNIMQTVINGTEEIEMYKSDYIKVDEAAPEKIGEIQGATTVTVGDVELYEISVVENITYDWGYPYQWNSTENNNIIELEFIGTLGTSILSVTPSNACGEGETSTLVITVNEAVSTNDEELQNVIVYPNPATTYLNISGVENNTPYNLVDISGKTHIKGNTDSKINIENLSNGLYFIVIEGYSTIKFNKQ